MKTKLSALLVCVLIITFHTTAQTPAWQWSKGIGDSGPDAANIIVADSMGNLYELGEVGTANVPFGPFTSPNNADGATSIAKYSANGTIVWADFYNSSTSLNYAIPGQPYFVNMILDHEGNLCAFGYFYTDIFVMGTDTIYAQTSTYGGSFMAKYNSATGALISVKQINRGSNPEVSISFTKITAGANGHFTALGSYFAYPYPNVPDDTMAQVYLPYDCHFIADMDSNGVYTKVQILTVDTGSVYSLLLDDFAWSSAGNFYLSGRYDSTSVAIARFHLPALSSDSSGFAFLAKLDSSFNFIWSIRNTYHFGNYYRASQQGALGWPASLASGHNDDVYMTGEFTGDTLLFDTFSIAAYHPFVTYSGTTFLAKFNSLGQTLWLLSAQAQNGVVTPFALASDPFDNAYLMLGAFGSDIMFGPDTLSSSLNIGKVNAQGHVVWTNGNTSGQFQPQIPLMAADGIGEVYVAGGFAGTNATFGNDTLILHPALPYGAGYSDMFTAKLGDCNPATPSVAASSALSWCGSDSVRLTATAGYIYRWSTGDTSRSIVVNTTGSYSVYAADTLGCYARSVSTSIHANPNPILNATVIQDVKCYGDSSGEINLIVSGGTAPYLYASLPPVSNYHALLANTYFITTTDSNGCHALDSVTVTEPAKAVSLSATVIQNVKCYGDSSGEINLSASGGTSPYLYASVPAIPNYNAVSANTYFITTIDSNGCHALDSVIVTQPATALGLTIDSIHTSTVAGNGEAIAIPSGGTSPYTYLWSNTAITDTIEQLPTGWYVVTVTDGNGCKAIDSVYIRLYNGIADISDNAISCYPNPTRGYIYVKSSVNGTIRVHAIDGSLIASQAISSGTNKVDVSNWASGIYQVEIIQDNTVLYNKKITIL